MARDDWDDEIILEDEMPSTRPYVVTGGNTQVSGGVAIETLVETVPASAEGLRFEKQQLAQLASSSPLSVAELSAHLKMPIGATMVLVGELIGSGTLRSHQTSASSGLSDLNIMSRIISRVREL